MSAFLRTIKTYSQRHRLSLLDRALLVAHYPLFKLADWARYGHGPRQAIGRRALRGRLARLRFTHSVEGPGGHRIALTVSFELGDLTSFQEVFWGAAYDPPFPLHGVRTYVDLGANTGRAFDYFRLRCTALERAVLVEPNPSLADSLERRASCIPGVTVVQACVSGDAAPRVELAVSNDHRHSRIRADEGTIGSVVDVANTTLSALLDTQGLQRVDLLKMDIEGAESSLLAEDAQGLARVDRLCAELHGAPAERDELVSALESIGLRVVSRRPTCPTAETCFAQRDRLPAESAGS